ncbi:MAG: hypothetical protein U0S49_05600 [Rhodospirillales bacterium]|nr:hypothetical protein [Rhodospirillales bacterium]
MAMRTAVSSLCDEAPPQPDDVVRPWIGQVVKPKFFGLLHLEQDENSAVNVATSSFSEQTAIYVNNAVTLSSSLKKRGIDFELLTNRRDLVEGALPTGRLLRITEIPFETPVPRGIKFYSAHFKVDALRYLSRIQDRYLVLSDLDVICINDCPEAFRNIIKVGIPLCYDISDQEIPSYGHDSILGDLRSVHGIEGEGRWLGGEFLGGTSEFFRRLVAKIDLIYPTYLSNLPRMRHVGDEALVSAAVELLRREGVYVADAGTIGIVARYWNRDSLHPQQSIHYYVGRFFLLHLPADKKFLSSLAAQATSASADVRDLYVRHWRSIFQTSQRTSRRSLRWLKGLAPRA